MMFLRLSRLASGYVRFSLRGDFPERFFNLCAVHGRAVWDMQRDPEGFSAYILAKDYPKLRQAARRSRVRLRVRERHGLPFFINRHRYRGGLAVGAVLLFIILYCFSQSFKANTVIKAKKSI